MYDRVATSLTDDEVSPLHDHNWDEECRVTGVLECLALSVRLPTHHTAQRLDLFVQCVRLSRLSVGFRTHSKSLQFHSFIHSFIHSQAHTEHHIAVPGILGLHVTFSSSDDLWPGQVGRMKMKKTLSYRKQTVRLLHNIEITLKPYSADRPISIKPRA